MWNSRSISAGVKQLAGRDALCDIRHVLLKNPYRSRLEFLPGLVVPATLAFVRCVLNDGRQHVFACRRQRLVAETRERDFEHRVGRAFAILGRIEGALDVVFGRRNHDALAVFLLVHPRNVWQAVECEVQLRRIATGAHVMHAACEARLHVSRANQGHHGALRVRVRDDGQAVETLTVVGLDTGDSTVLDDDAFHRLACSNRHACIACDAPIPR